MLLWFWMLGQIAPFDQQVVILLAIVPPNRILISADGVGSIRRSSHETHFSSRGLCKEPLVHTSALTSQLEGQGHALAQSLFADKSASIIADCSLEKNSHHGLFGSILRLEGGIIANHLRMRPEAVVILSNFEYADEVTLNIVHNLRDRGSSNLVTRGPDNRPVSAADALFVLATTRASCSISEESMRAKLIASLREARPELNWDYYNGIHFRTTTLCTWA